MRELISEATRTVEDSQTAQALHGLLSLKSPADCTQSATSSLLTSVGKLSMELIQQASAGPSEHQATAELHSVDSGTTKSPARSASQPVMPAALADRHATLRAAILSPGGTRIQPGAAGSAVQILLQMHQDDSNAAAKGKSLLRAKPASSASAGSVSVVPTSSTIGANTTHVLLDRSVPVRITVASAAPKVAPAAASSVPLSSVIRVSDSSSSPAVPIQLIATSQGVLAAVPQSYKILSQNVAAAAGTVPVSPARVSQPSIAAVASPIKRRLSGSSASPSSLPKVVKVRAAVTKPQVSSDSSGTAVHSQPTLVVANSLPHTDDKDAASTSNRSSLPNLSLQTAVRDSYEKLFWKVYLQSSSFQSMPRPLDDDGFNGSSEVGDTQLTTSRYLALFYTDVTCTECNIQI